MNVAKSHTENAGKSVAVSKSDSCKTMNVFYSHANAIKPLQVFWKGAVSNVLSVKNYCQMTVKSTKIQIQTVTIHQNDNRKPLIVPNTENKWLYTQDKIHEFAIKGVILT